MENLIRGLLKTSLGLLNVLALIVGLSNLSSFSSGSRNGVQSENIYTHSDSLFEPLRRQHCWRSGKF